MLGFKIKTATTKKNVMPQSGTDHFSYLVVDCCVFSTKCSPIASHQLKFLLRWSIHNSLKLVTHPSLPALTIDSSRRSLTMMSMLCWRRACRSQKRCVRQRKNMAGTVIISQMVKEVFSPWWPKLRLSWRVSGGSVCFRVGLYRGTCSWMWFQYYGAQYMIFSTICATYVLHECILK